jgi:peptide deformylase
LTKGPLRVRIKTSKLRRSQMNRKTKKMTAVEERFQQPLEKMLPELVTERGLSATAVQLGVSKATLGYWLLKLRIDVRRVALMPGETIEIKRAS